MKKNCLTRPSINNAKNIIKIWKMNVKNSKKLGITKCLINTPFNEIMLVIT